MLIPHKGHTDTIQVYSVTVMTHVKALQAGHSSQGTSEPITPVTPGRPEVSPGPNESPSATECVPPTDTGPDLSREGPFDARDAIHEQGQSPLVLDSMAGCQ